MIPLFIVGVACVLVCYFSASHSVLKTFSRKRLSDLLEERGRSHQLAFVVDYLPRLLLVTGLMRSCLGLVVVLATLFALEARLGVSASETPWMYVAAFLIGATLLSVFAVAIPVSWAQHRGERMLAGSIPVLRLLATMLFPIVRLLSLFDPVVRRMSGADLEENEDDMAEQIIAAVEDHDDGDTVADDQKQMIEAVFELRDTDAGEIMTPRTDMQGIELSSSFTEVKNAVIEHGHSRVPVYRGNLDDIAGILYAKDLLQLLHDSGEGVVEPSVFDLASLLREPFMIPESKKVLELLHEFRSTKVHMAIVLDEYGGTAGVITIEDILEEIVGDIQDEYEPEDDEPTLEPLTDGSARVDARLYVHDLNDKLGLDLPEDEDYDTVGGFVFATLGHIPEPGEMFEAHGVKITVNAAERTKVLSVTVEKLEVAIDAAKAG